MPTPSACNKPGGIGRDLTRFRLQIYKLFIVRVHIMHAAEIAHGMTFGPFRMPHLSEQVDEDFRRSFCSYLAEQVIPSLDG